MSLQQKKPRCLSVVSKLPLVPAVFLTDHDDGGVVHRGDAFVQGVVFQEGVHTLGSFGLRADYGKWTDRRDRIVDTGWLSWRSNWHLLMI